MTRSKELVSYSWKPLSPEASTFPHTHTRTTSYANIDNLLHIRVRTNPSLEEFLDNGNPIPNPYEEFLMNQIEVQEEEPKKVDPYFPNSKEINTHEG